MMRRRFDRVRGEPRVFRGQLVGAGELHRERLDLQGERAGLLQRRAGDDAVVAGLLAGEEHD